MPAIATAFRTIDAVTGMNLNHEQHHWVEHGTYTSEAPQRVGSDKLS